MPDFLFLKTSGLIFIKIRTFFSFIRLIFTRQNGGINNFGSFP